MKKIILIITSIIFSLLVCISFSISAFSENKEIYKEDSKQVLNNSNEKKEVSKKRNVAYFTSWSVYGRNVNIMDINPDFVTHINFAFANLQPDGEITVGDSWADLEKPYEKNTQIKGNFEQLKAFKNKYPDIKTLISIGGWTWSNNFSDVAASEQGRKKFAESAVNFIKKYNFDGIDIDWEYPVSGGNNIKHIPEDKYNYTKLLQQTRQALDEQGKKDNKHYLLTIAGGANTSFIENTELSEMIKYLDFINVMTYDYHGSWENKTGFNSPLYSNDNFSVSNSIQSYIKAGVEPSKINLGLAFYGKGWENVTSKNNNGLGQSAAAIFETGYTKGTWEAGSFDYWDIAQNYINKNGFIRYFDNISKVPYLFNGTTFITYEDEQSIKEKLNYADKMQLGGVMFWEFSADKEKELQKIIYDFYNTPQQNKTYNNN